MKANAPEKIYVCDNVFPNHVDWEGSPINTKRIDNHDIEYSQTDAFIEKARKWFERQYEWYDKLDIRHCNMKRVFYEFENYMKGE